MIQKLLVLSATSLPTISTIIPIYNGGTAFRQCLESLQCFRPHANQVWSEVIVVADGGRWLHRWI